MRTPSLLVPVTLVATALLAGCASTDTLPEPFVVDSIDDPTIFVGTQRVEESLSEVDRALYEARVEELRNILACVENEDTTDLTGIWSTAEGEVFVCRDSGGQDRKFYPIDPYAPGGTTAPGTERLFLTLITTETGYVGQVDGVGLVDGNTETGRLLPVEGFLTENDTRLVLIHEPTTDRMGALSLVLDRGLGPDGQLTLEKELALRISRLGRIYLAQPPD